MSDCKYRLESYPIYDCTGIAKHLEEMAAKGWMLERITSFYWKYRRITPQKLHFAVTYFPKADPSAEKPSPQQETLWEMCADAGWSLVTNCGMMQIFSNDSPHPIPLDTDEEIQLENIRQCMKKMNTSRMVPVFNMLAMMTILLSSSDSFLFRFSDASPLMIFPITIIILQYAIFCIRYRRWQKRVSEKGLFPAAPNSSGAAPVTNYIVYLLSVSFVLLLSLLCIFGMARLSDLFLGVMISLLMLMQTVTYSVPIDDVSVRRTQTILVSLFLGLGFLIPILATVMILVTGGRMSKDHYEPYSFEGKGYRAYTEDAAVPITLLTGTGQITDYSVKSTTENSPFLTHTQVEQTPRLDRLPSSAPTLSYETVKIKFPPIQNPIFNEYRKELSDFDEGQNLLPADAAPWDVQKAYELYQGTEPMGIYLLVGDNMIWKIHYSLPLTDTQKQQISALLRDNP